MSVPGAVTTASSRGVVAFIITLTMLGLRNLQDVGFIGGGITGLNAAIRLLEQGKRVCVLEAHEVGHGGSGRNVGLVNAGSF